MKIEQLNVREAAQLLGKSDKFIMEGLKQGAFPWGYAVKLTEWSFFINKKKLYETEGIKEE